MQKLDSIINTNTNINNQNFSSINTNKNNTNIDIDGINTKKNIDIEMKAKDLCEKLGSDPSRSLEFYCGVFHKLPEQTIYRLAGTVREMKNVRNPGAYFNMLISKELARR